MSGRNLCGNAGGKHLRYAQRAMRKFIPVMKNDKLNLWRAVYAERCKYGFRREYGTVEVGDRLCLPHDLDIQVSKLKLLKANHSSQKYRLEDNITKHYPAKIATMKERIIGYQTDIQIYKQNQFPDKNTFSMKLGNQIFTDRKEAGTALINMCQNVKASNLATTIGEYLGFKMKASYNSFFSKFTVNLKGSLSYAVEMGNNPLGNLQRLNHTLEVLPKELEDIEQQLVNIEHQLEIAKIEVKKPFVKEEELKEKLERLAELNALLDMDERGEEEIDIDVPKGRISVKEKLADMRKKVYGEKVPEKLEVTKEKSKEEVL